MEVMNSAVGIVGKKICGIRLPAIHRGTNIKAIPQLTNESGI